MKNYLRAVMFLILPLYISLNVHAQTAHTVQGIVLDSNKTFLPGATVKLFTENGDSLVVAAGAGGSFMFKDVKGDRLMLEVSLVGYQTLKAKYAFDNKAIFIVPPVVLQATVNNLNPVVVVSDNPVSIKEDTITYKANAYKVRENAPVEDVIRKLPGVDVDANGNVTAQGKRVTKVRVNGKDFFSGDVQTATRNLPADVVENIQMIDDYGDQANLTGVKTGEPDKIMNITIRADKNHGYTGQATLGGGEDALPQNLGVNNESRYVGMFTGFRFNGNQQLSVLGNVNNTNVNTFSFGSPEGPANPVMQKKVMADAAISGKANIGGGNFSSQASQQNGITTAHSLGVNFHDQWGKNLSVYGSYSFADNTVITQSNTLQQNTSPQTPAKAARAITKRTGTLTTVLTGTWNTSLTH